MSEVNKYLKYCAAPNILASGIFHTSIITSNNVNKKHVLTAMTPSVGHKLPPAPPGWSGVGCTTVTCVALVSYPPPKKKKLTIISTKHFHILIHQQKL